MSSSQSYLLILRDVTLLPCFIIIFFDLILILDLTAAHLNQNTAGLGIAFNAKPKVQESAQFRINQPMISTVLYMLGLNQTESEFVANEN